MPSKFVTDRDALFYWSKILGVKLTTIDLIFKSRARYKLLNSIRDSTNQKKIDINKDLKRNLWAFTWPLLVFILVIAGVHCDQWLIDNNLMGWIE